MPRVPLPLLALVALAGCATFPRPEGPPGPSLRDAVLLDPEPPRLVIEVDRVEGTAPRPRALRLLVKQLRLYLDKPGGIDVVIDDTLPAADWEGSADGILRLARSSRSIEAGPDAAVLHVLYGPRWKKFRGYAWRREVLDRRSPRYRAPLIVILQDAIRPILWVTGARQEASVLVHELGHTLGLATDPGHSSSGHCTNATCLMYDGVDAKTFFLYFFPTLFTGWLPLDYCDDCRHDLYEAHDGRPPGERAR